jgi:hypothetical protein
MIDRLSQVLELLCRDYNVKSFVPILEADVVAYMEHLWISQFGEAEKLHLDTRVYQKLDSRFDFVLGQVDYSAGKTCITRPELVAELKAFPYGFSDQQHRVHYFHVIEDDLPKLQSLTNPGDSRCEILFDEDDYLQGYDNAAQTSRIERLIKRRAELDARVRIALLRKTAKGLEHRFM